MRRWLLAGVVMAFPIMGTVALAGSASAVSPATGVSCTGLTGTINLSTGVVKSKYTGCNDTKNTGGSGKTKTTETATTAKITWNGTGTTTEGSISSTSVTSTCTDPNAIEEESTGTVTGGTGAAALSIKKGWTFRIFICADLTTGVLSLAPGTTFQIGKGL